MPGRSRARLVRIVVPLSILAAIGWFATRRPTPVSPGEVEALRSGRTSIVEFLKQERTPAPARFDARFLSQRERGLRASGLNASDVELIDVTDGSWWMRTRIRFTAPVPKQPDAGMARWRQVVYYHARGAAVLVSICVQTATDCPALDDILQSADQNLRERIAATDLDYVLPENTSCTIESMNMPGGSGLSRVRACYYGTGRVLTFMRLDETSTISDLLADRVDVP